MAPRIKVVQASNVTRQRRRTRTPHHPFNVRHRPFEICPFHIQPVLPGETMSNISMQSYALSDPVLNRSLGWHLQHQFYYVPMMALANGLLSNSNLTEDDIASLHLDQTVDFSSVLGSGANNAKWYEYKTGVPWLSECHAAIVKTFYRDEGDENSNVPSGLDYPIAYVNQRSWLQSAKEESATGDDAELPGVDDVEDLDVLTGYATAQSQWEIMRDSGTQDLTYDDYLAAQGVRVPGNRRGTPADNDSKVYPKVELLRFAQEWQYPSYAVDPNDGSTANSLKWKVLVRADKNRFFKEPGFIVGVTVARPKIYLGNQKGSIVGALTNSNHWLPKVLQGFGYTALKEVLDSATEGPLQNQDEDYWFDVGDLFNYGDQFVNYALAAGTNHGLPLPLVNMQKRYLTATDIKSIFVDTGASGANYVYQDGMVMTDILTSVAPDTTPGTGQP